MWFRKQEAEGVIILNLMAGLDLENSAIDRVGEMLVRTRGAPRVIVNFHAVEYLGSTFLNRLIILHKRITAAGGKLVLCGLNPVIEEIIRVTRLDGLFDLSGDQEQALGTQAAKRSP
jgi:anti-anti-sigma factor